MYTLAFHPEANNEFAEAIHWYEEQKEGLGKTFLLAVEKIIKKIQYNPTLFSYTIKSFKEAAIPSFPYVIVYKTSSANQIIYISAIYHTSRDPKKKYRK